MSTTRYWAPERTDRPLDDAVLAMLETGDDPEKDLGLHLMAAHRAGAAAVQGVAKRDLVSEESLIETMAGIREQLADRMVDAIAKHHEPVYSALLVRDFFDDAEDGAVSLYRTAVSKGVSPPVAAERVAHVYGMPMKEMGAYIQLAVDAKTPPRTIEDSADRTLLGYVAKAAATEQPLTHVSKAGERPMSVAERVEFNREHPRDARGRFTDKPDEPVAAPTKSPLQRIRERLGLSSAAPTQVADTPVRERQTRQTKRPAHSRASHRRAKPKLEATGRTRQTTRTQTVNQSRKQTLKLTRAQTLDLSRRLNRGAVDTDKARPKGMPIPDALQRLPETGSAYYPIGQGVVIGASSARAATLRTSMSNQAMTQKDPSRRIFRLGHLLNVGVYTEKEGKFALDAHEGLAQREVDQSDFISPEVIEVGHDELGASPRDDMAYLENRRQQMASREIIMPSGDSRQVVDHEELQHIHVLPIYRPYSSAGESEPDEHGAMAIVHYRPSDPGDPLNRPMPSVDEYVIETEARGVEEGTAKQPQLELDPNQIYEIVNASDVSPMERVRPEQYYDIDGEVIVNRWFLRPLEQYDVDDIIEGVEKAATGLMTVAERIEFEQEHPRDELGRFAPKPDTQTRRVTRPTRSRRPAHSRGSHRRMVRRVQSLSQDAGAQSPTRSQTRSQTLVQTRKLTPLGAALNREHTKRTRSVKHRRNMPVLSDVNAYKVLSEGDFQRMTEILDKDDFLALHRGKTIPLDYYTRTLFATSTTKDTGVEGIAPLMARNVSDQIDRERTEPSVVDVIRIGAIPDYDHIAQQIHATLDKFPETDLLELARHGDRVYIYSRSGSATMQNVVEYDPDLNFDGPLVLSYLGEYRARDVLARKDDVETSLIGDLSQIDMSHEGVVPNPMVHHYKLLSVTSPPVRRWRVDNE